MTNKSVSDYVAATMNAVLNSDEHKSLFANYKTASDENNVSDSLCAKCKYSKDSCTCGSSMSADDNDARTKQVSDEDSSDVSCADDDEASDSSSDSNKAEDKEVPMSSSAFDIAIDSLLTASAALDSVGFEKSSIISLKLASFVVEAKKKEKDKKDSKKDKKKDSKDSKKKPAKSTSSSKPASSKSTSSSKPSSSSKSSKKPLFGKKK